jgi:hypothetical protein
MVVSLSIYLLLVNPIINNVIYMAKSSMPTAKLRDIKAIPVGNQIIPCTKEVW